MNEEQGIVHRMEHEHDILQSLHSLHRKLDTMATAIENLQAAVAAETTVEASVVTLLQTLSTQLQAAIATGNVAAVQAVADQITNNTAILSAAVAANTPGVAPAPTPPPAPTP